MKLTSILLALAIFAPAGVRADVTIRYQSEIAPSAALKPMIEKAGKMLDTGSATTIRMKGNKAYTTSDTWIQIFDFVKQEVTLADPVHKTFAVFPISQYTDKPAGGLPQTTPGQTQALQQAMASIKTHVDSKMTGNTAEIQGVQCEERELTLTMDVPLPTTLNQTGPTMKMVMHIWTPKKEEVLRVPAIRELTGYQNWQRYVMNPTGMMDKFLGKMGMSNTLGPILDEMYKNPSVIMRTRMEMYMPFLAVLTKQMAAKDQTQPALDPDAPLMEMTQEVAELSSAPVDASLLEIPADYAAIPADDLVRDMIKQQTAAGKTTPAPESQK